MYFTATREAVLNAVAPLLSIAQRGIKTNQNILTLRSLSLSLVQISCSDDNAEMTTLAAAAVKREGVFAVAAKRFNDVVRSFPAGASIEFHGDGTHLAIVSGGSRFRVNCASLPQPLARSGGDTQTGAGGFSMDSAEFAYLLGVALHALPEATSTLIPNAVLMHMTGERLRLIGTNGGRMAVSSAAVSSTPARIVLSANTVADFKAVLSKASAASEVNLRWEGGILYLSCGDIEYQAGMGSNAFLDYEKVVASTQIVPFHVGLDDLRGIVGRMMIVSNAITVKLEGRTLTIGTEVSEGKKKGEECSESMEIPRDAKQVADFQVTLNGRFLLDGFNAVRGEPVHLSYNGNGAFSILASNGEARIYVMPLRV